MRNIGFDYLRALCILSVAASHSFDTNASLSRFSDRSLTFSVSCFFMMAVFLMTKNLLERKEISEADYWRRRFRQILPGFTFWTLLYAGARSAHQGKWLFEPQMLAAYFFLGSAAIQLYFVPLLIYFSVVIRFLLRKLKQAEFILMSVFLLAIFYESRFYYHALFNGESDLRTAVVYVIDHFPDALWGALLYFVTAKLDPRVTGLRSRYIVFACCVVSLMLVLPIMNAPPKPGAAVYGCFSLAVFLCGYYWPFDRMAVVEWLSKMSFSIYLSHHLFIELAQWFEQRAGVDITSLGMTLGNYFFGLFLSVILAFFYDKVARRWKTI